MAEKSFSLHGTKQSGVLRTYRVGDIFSSSDAEPESPPEPPEEKQTAKAQEPKSRIEVIQTTVTLENGLQPFLNPQTIQINAPHRIPAEELRPYLQSNKKVVCLNRHKRPIMATLSAIRDDHLVATIYNKDALKLIRWKGEPVAVIFKVDEQHTYLLQTHVQDIFSTEVLLAYKDPRFYPRFRMELDRPARIRSVRSDWAQALSEDGSEFMRETTWGTIGKKKAVTGLTDRPCGQSENVPVSAQGSTIVETGETVEQERQGQVYDISQGGVRLVVEGQRAQDCHTHKVVTVTISLPQVQEMQGAQDSRELSVLSVIRNVRQVETSTHIHCRFVEALPDELVPLFRALQLAETEKAA
ncbi:MAG: PilZ domain-containing protein [bacterium]|nr:PilZ domain-containing protein [bacterium]